MTDAPFNSYTLVGYSTTIKVGSVITSPNGHTWKVTSLEGDKIMFDAGGKIIPIHILDIEQLINLGYTITE